ncbi:MAG: hypothetical protein JRE14_17610 [Deltaproteobacteria bacterium]|nr:hypothetical protein [Deltaproteobacteria bacterium]
MIIVEHLNQEEISGYMSDSSHLCITGVDYELGQKVTITIHPDFIDVFMKNLGIIIRHEEPAFILEREDENDEP